MYDDRVKRWLAAVVLVTLAPRPSAAEPDAVDPHALPALPEAVPAPAPPPPPPPTPFDRGRVAVSAGAGERSVLGDRYFVLGLGASYFVLRGLALDLDGTLELGPGPTIGVVAPGVRYVAAPLVGVSPLVPYVGAFYQRAFVGGGLADTDAIGGRAGALYVQSRGLVLGLGVVVARTVSTCATDCTAIYPDVTIALSF